MKKEIINSISKNKLKQEHHPKETNSHHEKQNSMQVQVGIYIFVPIFCGFFFADWFTATSQWWKRREFYKKHKI